MPKFVVCPNGVARGSLVIPGGTVLEIDRADWYDEIEAGLLVEAANHADVPTDGAEAAVPDESPAAPAEAAPESSPASGNRASKAR